MKVINLSGFELEDRHLDLLRKGISFSPTSRMDHFEIYKDLFLFLRKVYYKILYSEKQATDGSIQETNPTDIVAIDQLVSLLEEGGPSLENDKSIDTTPWRKDPNLKIRLTSMLQFRKNKWPGVFLDVVQEDLDKVDRTITVTDNLSPRKLALKELQNAERLVFKPSDKGGNVVLLSTNKYESEVCHLLSDKSTYSKLDLNPFP